MVEYAEANEDEVPQARQAVFGFLKRGGKVFTAMIPNAKTETLLPIIKEKVY